MGYRRDAYIEPPCQRREIGIVGTVLIKTSDLAHSRFSQFCFVDPLAVTMASFATTVIPIVLSCADEQVLRIDTNRVVAGMQNLQIIGNGAMK